MGLECSLFFHQLLAAGGVSLYLPSQVLLPCLGSLALLFQELVGSGQILFTLSKGFPMPFQV